MIRRLTLMAVMIGAVVVSMAIAPEAAFADKRVALVVGNSNYQTVPQLPNPSRDASAIAKLFRDAGFDTVDIQLDVGNLEFKRAIRRFEATADQADIAVVYFAGHGLEVAGANYLIPVDARLASDRDTEDEAIPLERLVSSADGAKHLRLVILDACRDNPFLTTMRRERRTATRAIASGLGRVEPTSTDTLIAYAAKAGSTADDGDGQHSPFTAAILKNLTVPGLDVRLAFGRIRDEVLKETASRQEPFVYGSLGGSNISLVPAPVMPQEAPVADVKADYELVQQIGTKRAWEVFLGTHPTGFYAELAKARIEQLNAQQAPPNVTVASLAPQQPPTGRESSSREAIEWDKVKDSTEIPVLQRFIRRFPNAPLALNAQQRIDVLKRAAQEREEKARAEREAARQAAEAERRKAEQQKAELAAQKKRDEEERRARETEAAEKARAAAAELAAKKKRDEERQAAAAEAARQAKAVEAERKAQEAKQKAEQAEREKNAATEAAARAVAEKQAKEAEAARKTAELAAAKEATCKDEQSKLDAIVTKGSEATGVDDLQQFSRTVTCERLAPVVVAAIDRFNAEVAKRAATRPNSPELVRTAQTELVRLGCLSAKADGKLNDQTMSALSRYLKIEGQPADNPSVTEALVAELNKHATRVCPIQCDPGETLKGAACVADRKPQAPPAIASRKSDEGEDTARHRKQANREEAQPRRRKSAPEVPRAREQALARPSIVSGGGGSHPLIGVGF
jgi:hypothetical protein